MYFNQNQEDTNIDKEFDNKKITIDFSNFNFQKLKLPLIIVSALLVIILMIIIFTNRSTKTEYFITLKGEETITIYKNAVYNDPGYIAFDNKNNDLTSEVKITSSLDTTKIGNYEVTYTLKNTSKTRNINVVEKPIGATTIFLKGNLRVYIQKGEEYEEPGYIVIDSIDSNLNDKVIISNNVDTSKAGIYQVIYTIVNSSGITTSVTRTIIVMDSDISLSLSNNNYTNTSVGIDFYVIDNYFDYAILPNNTKITTSSYTYNVSNNGTYTFTVYNKKGMKKEASITVSNIDKTAPTGNCTVTKYQSTSTITINAQDQSGIQKYIYNNQAYTKNEIQITSVINSAQITIYDNAGNTKQISCQVTTSSSSNNTTNNNNNNNFNNNQSSSSSSSQKQTLSISSISKDGVIVTVKAKKANSNIAGYYFSYSSTRPNKSTGGYVATSNTSIDVVRLPGTTYVWVEDKSGNISASKKITLRNNVLIDTSDYKILEGTSLSKLLSNNSWSIDGLNNLIARSVRAAGLYTKTAAATSAVALQTVIAQKYNVKLPYWWGGKYRDFGADSTWGSRKVTTGDGDTYYYYGLDCTGFATWTYINAGFSITSSPSYLSLPTVSYSKDNGEIGDFLVSSYHTKLIIGKTDKGFVTAEAKGKAYGMMITTQSYSSSKGFKIAKGESFMKKYSKASSYPSGY